MNKRLRALLARQTDLIAEAKGIQPEAEADDLTPEQVEAKQGLIDQITALNDQIAHLCHGGNLSMLGIPTENTAIDWSTVVFNMLTLKGIYGREMYETWYKMSVMIQSGLDIAPVITHRMPFRDFADGFAAMNDGVASKVVLRWDD